MTEQTDMLETPPEFTEGQVNRGLRWSIAASAFGVMHYRLLSPTSLLAVGIMLTLGVTKFQIGVLAATMPLARFAEIVASYQLQRTGRRREIFTWTHIASRLLWVPFVLTFFIRGEFIAWRIPTIFFILLASSLLLWTGSNAWLSWMGDLVPRNRRARYFGIRQIWEKGFEIAAGLCVGYYLLQDPPYEDLILVVCLLVGFGIIDILIFRYLVPHPRLAPTRQRGQLKGLFTKAMHDRTYRKLIVFIGSWMFASGLMTPYMFMFVRGKAYLGMSYRDGYWVVAISGACLMGMSYFWGRVGDRWRPRRALALCVVIGLFSPFGYVFATPAYTLPVYVSWAIGSTAWAGIMVLSFQYAISMAPAKERSIYLAFQSAALGLVTAAAFLSADGIVWLLQWVSIPAGLCDLQLLFCLAGVGRALSLIPLSRMEDTHRS